MHFKTTEINIDINGLPFTILSVTNFDELYERLLAKGLQHEDVADERIPYWAELWPSAVGLSEYLVSNGDILKGKTTLEIGCGLGLPSLVAAALGADVTATDYLQDAVDFARRNAERNEIKNIRFETLDWRNTQGLEAFDILLASDVVYERKHFEPLLKAFDSLVKPNGMILLSEPNRYIAEPFIEAVKGKGYLTDRFHYDVMVKDIKSKVSVYAIRYQEIS